MTKKEVTATLIECRAFMYTILDYRKRPAYYASCAVKDFVDIFNVENLVSQIEDVMRELGVIFEGDR